MSVISNFKDIQLEILRSLPGLFVVMDDQSKFLFSTPYTLKLFGFSSEEQVTGLDATQIRCPAVESASLFLQQDQFVRERKQEVNIFDIHQYADGGTRLLLTKKLPIYIDDTIGTICQCTELNSQHFSALGEVLTQTDEKYNSKPNDSNRSYTIGQSLEQHDLSERELEVLFYLLRGKTMKVTAKILGISWRTVEAHLNNIKAKWQCANKNAVIDYAINKGLLGYLPKSLINQNISFMLSD